jgi:hypothetical protein
MKKSELVLGLLIVALGVGLFVLNRQTADQTVQSQPQSTPAAVVESEVPLLSISAPQLTPTTRTNSKSSHPKQSQLQTNQSLTPENELPDPDPREVLAMVGMDDEADQFWLNAIFDTSLSDKERADMMEDLNEAGFDDPKNVTADDLPLILNRLELIEAVLPNADDFMTEHLTEAQKDLAEMLTAASGQPQQ